MTDAENSDDERYANESFEKESDAEVPEMSELESETTENSDEEENLPSVKANTVPLKRKSFSINKTDAVPYDSSSDEEYEIIMGETLAEINTPSMLFEDESMASVSSQISIDGENKESSEEMVEEEEDEEEELKRIKLIEEKYLKQISADMREVESEQTENFKETLPLNTDEIVEAEEDYEEVIPSDSESENGIVIKPEEEPKHEDNDENDSQKEYHEEIIQNVCEYEACCSPEVPNEAQNNSLESLDQTKLVQIIRTSLTSLRINSSESQKDQRRSSLSSLRHETKVQAVEAAKIADTEEIALAVINALKSAGFNNLSKSQTSLKEQENNTHETQDNTINECNNRESFEEKETEMVKYQDDFEEEEKEKGEKTNQVIYYDGQFDYRISSKTPTSFNSDDYLFHANLIRTFYRTDSIDKLRAKPHPRKSMSFSNERMREIERHNHILLRKILTQKPTYSLKSKPSQSSLQKHPSQTNTRLTTSALNRKKQQRQIDLDNQVLKRKIEAIALRRPPFVT